ncbi:MAG: hypothetical protein GC158_05775 [Cyanobacteria bacterium RI_101]|nr:hypothetical protein [Cyanobacteria bacterium RI_101]
MFAVSFRSLGWVSLLSLVLGLNLGGPGAVQAQTPAPAPAPEIPTDPFPAEEVDETDPNSLRPLNQPGSVLSLAGAKKIMDEANAAIGANDYAKALDKLQQARRIYNQLSNFHLQLANSFTGISPAIFEEQRTAALKTGQLRDEATYRLALVHRVKNEPELAVPLLIQIIRSQNPTTDLGRKAYQQLLELGFVDTPFNVPTPANPAPSGAPAPAAPSNPTPAPSAPATPK